MATLAERLALSDMLTLTDAEAAAALNVPASGNGSTYIDIDPRDWLETLINSGEWGRIKVCADLVFTGTLSNLLVNGDLTNVSRLRTFADACTSTTMIRTSRSAVRTVFSSLIDALVTASFISAGTSATLKAFASRNASWAEANGYPAGVTARDVGIARGSKA